MSIILGTFQKREVTCKALGCRYSFQEEKKTDVNIAVEIMTDAFDKKCDRICVVSGDSDIQPVIEWVSKNRPEIKVTVYIPSLPVDQSNRRTDYYLKKRLPVECKFLPLKDIPNHQMKGAVKLADGNLAIRPHLWASAKKGQS